MKEQIKLNRETMNRMLPDIPPEFEQEMRRLTASLPVKRKEKVMRKKISLGLVLTLILVMITVGAAAAVLLGGKDFVDQIMAPKAKENQDKRFTQAEVNAFIAEAKEYGIELPDYALEALEQSENGEYKDELMKEFVKTEYGFYPAGWPLEVQNWYNRLMVECGMLDTVNRVLPGEGEITEEEMLQFVRARVEQDDPGAPLDDPEKYLRLTTYTESKETPYRTVRTWDVEYDPQDLYLPQYVLSLDSQGQIMSYLRMPGILDVTPEDGPHLIANRFFLLFSDVYGSTEWNTSLLLTYQDALRQYQLRYPEADMEDYAHILRQTYLPEDSVPVTKALALEAAAAAVAPALATQQNAVLMQGESGPLWKISQHLSQEGTRSQRSYVEIDAESGAVLTNEISESYDGEWRSLVPESYWRANAAPRSTPEPLPMATTRPDGKPWVWYNPVAPESFWARLDEIGYDTATLMANWYAEYGDDASFWPLEAQAIYYIRFEIDNILTDLTGPFPGLPDENDISQEQAAAIAQAALEKEMAADGPDFIASLRPKFSFCYHAPNPEDHEWIVTFFFPGGEDVFVVKILAQTGEIISTDSMVNG